MSEYFENVLNNIYELGLNEISQDLIDSVNKEGFFMEDESLKNAIKNIFDNPIIYENIQKDIYYIRDNCNHEDFWNSFVSVGLNPKLFHPVCLKLMKKSGKIARTTCLLYSTLLGMNPLSFSYNDKLVQILLKNMIVASQAVESKRSFTDKEGNYVVITCDLFTELSKAINKDFFETAGVEVFTAFVELAFKIGSHVNKEVLRYAPNMSDATLMYIKAAFSVSYEHVLPYLVSTLLSDAIFKTVRANRFKQDIIKSAIDVLQGKDSQLLLICQHLIVRCPDRIGSRENTSQCVNIFFNAMNNKNLLIDFIKRCCSTHKTSIRSVACDVLKNLLSEISEDEAEELLQISLKLAQDIAPSVRSAAVSSLCYLTENEQRWKLAKENMNIEFILKRRLRDEKISVRRAAMKLLKSALMITSEMDDFLLKMVGERTNDMTVAIRQEAINSLSDYFSRFPNEEVFEQWLECILPRAIETDQKTQDIAISIFEKDFMENIDKLNSLCSLITNNHVEIITKIFQQMIGKEKSLKPFSKVLIRFLHNNENANPNMWIICNALNSAIGPKMIPKNYLNDFWEKRKTLPYFFLSIVSMEKDIQKEWIKDSIEELKKLSNKKALLSFGSIHFYVKIASSSKGSHKDINDLILRCTKEVNNYTVNPSKNIDIISAIIFLIGEAVLCIEKKNFDFEDTSKICFGEEYPTKLRSVAVLTLSKACLLDKELAQAVILHFSNDIAKEEPDEVKMNQITALCDLCVHYTSIVDPFIDNILNTIMTDSQAIKKHAIISITRLIAEDYIKLKPLIFYKFMAIIACNDKSVSNFASICLFDILVPKNPKIIKCLSDSITFFNSDEPQLFAVKQIKHKAMYQHVISKMSDVQLLEVIQLMLSKYIKPFIMNHDTNAEDDPILRDSLIVMGDAYQKIIDGTAQQSERLSDAEMEASIKIMEYVHKEIAQKIIPSLVELNKILKEAKSELQGELKRLLALIASRDPTLIEYISVRDEGLAVEVESDANDLKQENSIPPSPVMKRMFSSNLLSSIVNIDAERPRISFSQPESQDDLPIFEKRPPSAFDSQED